MPVTQKDMEQRRIAKVMANIKAKRAAAKKTASLEALKAKIAAARKTPTIKAVVPDESGAKTKVANALESAANQDKLPVTIKKDEPLFSIICEYADEKSTP
jgi:hypothetical protein